MRVLVTGATGFLGKRVVDALGRRGHEVRALVRPSSKVPDWGAGVQTWRGDLREPGAAAEALGGVDAVVHLAAQVTGSDEARFLGTVVATEHLLEALAAASVRRLVLASSFSVYDWARVDGELNEHTPLESQPRLYERDGYAVAKWWQERVVRLAADRGDLDLTVLRPGFVWGPGNEVVDGVGQRVGGVQLVLGPRSALPLTYVDNCADCFATAVDSSAAVGTTLNVVDGRSVSRWRYARDVSDDLARVPVPYGLALRLVKLVHRAAGALLGERLRLPSIFVPRRFEARFKPVRASATEAQRVLGWTPPIDYEEALRRTRNGCR